MRVDLAKGGIFTHQAKGNYNNVQPRLVVQGNLKICNGERPLI
jgi:hypothetical protein